jgi:sulfotransferase
MKFLPLASIPRSGSTLLLYILNQNPKFTIGPDSEISYILNSNRNNIRKNIHSYQLPHEDITKCFLNFCRSGVDAWIETLRKEDTIFLDKSRGWISDLDFTFKVFPDQKIIINIRDLRSVLNSFEKIHSDSLFENKHSYYKDIENDLQRQRLDGILQLPMIKEPLTTLRELIEIPKKYKDKILITRHEDLIEDPQYFMQTLYDFIELPYFEHDFDDIKQERYYNDNPYMPYGKHKISNKLTEKVSNKCEFIRPDLLDNLVKGYSWYFDNFYSDRM